MSQSSRAWQDESAPISGRQPMASAFDAATIEARHGDGYRVRFIDGTRHQAQLARGVSPGLADECLRDGRIVLLALRHEPPLIIGALQTAASVVTQHDGVVTVAGRDVRLEATRGIALEAGSSRLHLSSAKLQIWGERLTMHVASLIKLVASKVELP